MFSGGFGASLTGGFKKSNNNNNNQDDSLQFDNWDTPTGISNNMLFGVNNPVNPLSSAMQQNRGDGITTNPFSSMKMPLSGSSDSSSALPFANNPFSSYLQSSSFGNIPGGSSSFSERMESNLDLTHDGLSRGVADSSSSDDDDQGNNMNSLRGDMNFRDTLMNESLPSNGKTSSGGAAPSSNINQILLRDLDIDQYVDIKHVVVRASKVFIARKNGFDVYDEDGLLIRKCDVGVQPSAPSKRNAKVAAPSGPVPVVERIFVNPDGDHVLISCEDSQVFYFNMRWRGVEGAKQVPNLSSIPIESVAWKPEGNDDEPDMNYALIGTRNSKLYSLDIHDTSYADMSCEQVFDFAGKTDVDNVGPIMSIDIQQAPPEDDEDTLVIIVCTGQMMFHFVGGPDFATIFEDYTSMQILTYKEFPLLSKSKKEISQLATFSNFDERTESFAWLCHAGVVHGPFNFIGLQNSGNPIPEVELIKWDQKDIGISIVLSAYHMFILTEEKLLVYMLPAYFVSKPAEGLEVSEISFSSIRKVYEKTFDKRVEGTPKGLCYDEINAGIYVYTNTSVTQIDIEDEENEVWKLFLERAIDVRTSKPNYFTIAERLSRDVPSQLDRVLTEKANYFFNEGLFQEAASLYNRTTKPFEEICMKFANKNEWDALRTYLSQKLEFLKEQRKSSKDPNFMATQLTCVSMWLTELYVSKIDSLTTDDMKRKFSGTKAADDSMSESESEGEDESEKSDTKSDRETLQTLREEFHEFLEENVDFLSVNKMATFRIIESHTHMEDVMFFAILTNEYRRVISDYIFSGNFEKALRLLDMKCDSAECKDFFSLIYTFAPILMQHLPKETVDMLMRKNFLDPCMLVPALMRYKAQFSGLIPEDENYVIQYLHWCIVVNENKDPSIHNLLLLLYAQQDEDEKLSALLETEPHFYNEKYALRICQKYGKMKACVELLMSMESFEDAVKLALEHNEIDLARQCAERSYTSDSIFDTGVIDSRQKALWLMIAQYIITTKCHENNLQNAISFLETTNVLQLEDILPLFPDFKQIKNFREIVVKCLEDHNSEIQSLKEQMEDVNDASALARYDISQLKHRGNVITPTNKCTSVGCTHTLYSQDFYMFPCGHLYHTRCLTNELRKVCSATVRQSIDSYVAQLRVKDKRLQAQISLDEIISRECPLCSDYFIDTIDSKFISSNDQEAKSWMLTSGQVQESDSELFSETDSSDYQSDGSDSFDLSERSL